MADASGIAVLGSIAFAAALMPFNAAAEIYRCEKGGRLLYTDTPCSATAMPMELQVPTAIAAGGNADLAHEHDQRIESGRRERDQADAQWLKAHAAHSADDERLRNALVESRVVQGMSPAQVRQVWGEPSDIENSIVANSERERWVYRQGKHRKTVSFEDGKVRGLSGNSIE